MKVKSLRGSALPLADADRQPVPRVAVVRRIDSKPPTRMWSLLLPPSFSPDGRKPAESDRRYESSLRGGRPCGSGQREEARSGAHGRLLS